MLRPLRVSSYWTLMWKIFLPTMWIVFFGSVTVFLVLLNGMGAFHLSLSIKAIIIFIFASGFAMLYFTLMDLKRVEMAADHFYVTNYFKTYRYTYDSLAAIHETDLLLAGIVTFVFKEKSSFGRKIRFMKRRKVWGEFIEQNPEKFAHLV